MLLYSNIQLVEWVRVMIDVLNKLASKGLKLWLVVIGVIIVFAVISTSFNNVPPAVSKAKDLLFNGYYDANIYEDTSCRTAEFGSDWVILCERIGGESNQGIYEVKVISEGKYIIYAVNGSAKTHAGRMGMNIDFNRESKIDISEVKKEIG